MKNSYFLPRTDETNAKDAFSTRSLRRALMTHNRCIGDKASSSLSGSGTFSGVSDSHSERHWVSRPSLAIRSKWSLNQAKEIAKYWRDSELSSIYLSSLDQYREMVWNSLASWDTAPLASNRMVVWTSRICAQWTVCQLWSAWTWRHRMVKSGTLSRQLWPDLQQLRSIEFQQDW